MKTVFISYVRENSEVVDRLTNFLRAWDISVWLDRDALKPGTRWADAIRQAIRDGSFFIACLSNEYNAKRRTYMNEELTLAIEELRLRAIDQAWFIPVLPSETAVPDRVIGGGETLRSIQQVSLYKGWDEGLTRILSIIQPEHGLVNKLIAQLADRSARARIAASDRLAEMGGTAKQATPALIGALSDDNETVVRASVAALAAIAGPTEEVIEALLYVMCHSKSFYVEKSVHHALQSFAYASLGIEEMVSVVEIKPKYCNIVANTLRVMRIRDAITLDKLIRVCSHKRPELRASAAYAIADHIRDPKNEENLKKKMTRCLMLETRW